MKVALSVLFLLGSLAYGQNVRMTNASKSYDLEVSLGECQSEGKSCPMSVRLFRKGSKKVFQALEAGPIAKDEVAESIVFVDLDFDGIRDLAVFDGFEAPGGYATLAQRIYLYSKANKRFELNSDLSELSHRENLASSELSRKDRLFYTYARPGGGVFQKRGYRMVKEKPVLMYELVSDATIAEGKRTRDTTRKLINGRWRTWTKTYKGPLN